MKWNKKGIDKPVEKEKLTLDACQLGMVEKFKPVMLFENLRANMLGSADYQTRRLRQIVLLDAEYRKAEALTLIRRASLI